MLVERKETLKQRKQNCNEIIKIESSNKEGANKKIIAGLTNRTESS